MKVLFLEEIFILGIIARLSLFIIFAFFSLLSRLQQFKSLFPLVFLRVSDLLINHVFHWRKQREIHPKIASKLLSDQPFQGFLADFKNCLLHNRCKVSEYEIKAYQLLRLQLETLLLRRAKTLSIGLHSGVYWGRVTHWIALFVKKFFTSFVLWMEALSMTTISLFQKLR